MSRPSPRVLGFSEAAHAEALASALGVARRLGIPQEVLYVGAGTALCLRWQHRPLTGVWLFRPPRPQGNWRKNRISIPSAIEQEGGSNPIASGRWCTWSFQGMPVGIYPSSPMTEPRSPQTESTTQIPVESSFSALRKKVVARMEATGDLVPRDAVDILECARSEPRELCKLLQHYAHIHEICSDEYLHLSRIEPLEMLKPLWDSAARIFAKDLADPPQPLDLPPEILSPQKGKKSLADIDYDVRLLPDEAFAHPLFAEKGPFREANLHHSFPSMAGHPLSPSAKELQAWLLTEERENLSEDAASYMKEFLKQMHGAQLFAFRQSCGASLRDIARMARWTDCLMSSRLKSGLNRLPRLLSTGDRTEEFDGYTLLTGLTTPG